MRQARLAYCCWITGLWVLVTLFGLGLAGAPASGQSNAGSVAQVGLTWSSVKVHRGMEAVLAVSVAMAPGYHINPSRSQLEDPYLIPTELVVTGSDSALVVGEVQYPKPTSIAVGAANQRRQIDGYERQVVLYVPMRVSRDAALGAKNLDLAFTYQACDETRCLSPQTERLATILMVVDDATPLAAVEHDGLFAGYDASTTRSLTSQVALDVFHWRFSVDGSTWAGTLGLLGVAGLGGLLLNFTPCVLPVIPLKILGLSQSAGDRRRCFVLGLMMSMGVVAFWLVLGGAIAAVSGFTATNQLFQYPIFTMTVGLTIALMAVGMCGLFNMQLPRWVYQINPSHDTLLGSFGFGVMTAILSTPCTAPFMGAAAAWAATQHSTTTLATFSVIGVGMALPYLVLSAMPGLIQKMPRTGPASVLIKQVMGLLMLAVAAYFIGVGVSGWLVTPPDPPGVWYWWAVMAWIAAAGGWMVFRAIAATTATGRRSAVIALGGVLILASVWGGVRLTDQGPIEWVYYTPARFRDALRAGHVVVMDFTAEWCLNCKWLERNVLHQQAVVDQLNEDDVTAIKVDLTGHHVSGREMLKQTGRLTIPLLVVYTRDGSESFKSDFYTADQVVTAINQARPMK